MSALQTLRRDVHSTTLAYRSLDRVVQSKIFEEAFNIETDHRDLLEALAHVNVEWVEGWIESTIKLEIGELSMRDLRIKAQQYRIPRYTSMGKDALIIALTQAVHHARISNEAQIASSRLSGQEEGYCAGSVDGVG